MASSDRSALAELLERFSAAPVLVELRKDLGDAEGDALTSLYREALPYVEAAVWASGAQAKAVELYQRCFREWEALCAAENDDRHRFVVIIPVADRPQHLRNILASLLELCSAFNYGGVQDGRYRKVLAVIADDTLAAEVVERNRAVAAEFRSAGLAVEYFGASEQADVLARLERTERAALLSVLGEPEASGLAHKGASINRNLAYLYAAGLVRPGERTLFYFVDSDQQFRVRLGEGDGYRDVMAVNYLYHLDRLFRQNPEIQVLTGKVVGDPPVSPAVMAGNFLGDVIAFLEEIAARTPADPCSFHGRGSGRGEDAAYHDMAELFGFKPAGAYRYRCDLPGAHDHAACLAGFAGRLDRFFDGEHPTRMTLFDYPPGFSEAQPARTVYTGNYVCSEAGLAHFIPFATLRLRMAGPALGRLLQAEIGARFVSANLPMLHARTLDVDGAAEFRPGVRREAEAVDLSGEFERQYFGDVMLFTVKALVEQGYPERIPGEAALEAAIGAVEGEMQRRYADKRREIGERLLRAEALLEDPAQWWRQSPEMQGAVDGFRRFLLNLRRNFGPDAAGYRLTTDEAHRTARRLAIRRALAGYPADRAAWGAVLERFRRGPA